MTTAAIAETTMKTNTWLNELAAELDWDDSNKVFRALRVVLHLLRDRLPLIESAQLASQLPMLIRGAYYENWVPRQKPEHCAADRFVEHVASAFPDDFTINPESVVRAVFCLLRDHVSVGEINHVRACLGRDYERLWY
jgi:uncharacterized protein (DUF2267 family)